MIDLPLPPTIIGRFQPSSPVKCNLLFYGINFPLKQLKPLRGCTGQICGNLKQNNSMAGACKNMFYSEGIEGKRHFMLEESSHFIWL